MASPSHDPRDESPWFPPQGWWPCHEPLKRLSRWRRLSIQAKRHLPPPKPSQEEDDRWLQRAAEQQREREAAEARRASEAAKRHEEERAAAVEVALHGDLESLPRVESITAEEFLALLGHDAQLRFEVATELPGICATLVSLESNAIDNGVWGILDCGYCEPGQIPDAILPVLAGYDENEARRYIAWAKAAEIFPQDEIHWLDFDEVLRLPDMLPQLEAQSLEQQAEQLDREADHEESLLPAPDYLDDLHYCHPEIEDEDLRRMSEELDCQQGAVDRKGERADKLRHTAAALRRRRDEDEPS